MPQIQPINVWADIEHFIDQICSFQAVSPMSYMNVHSQIINYINCKHSIRSRTIPDRVRCFQIPSVLAIVGGEIYHHIKFCLRDKIASIIQSASDMTDVDVLQLYVKYWQQYKLIGKQLHVSCHYIDEYWVARQNINSARDILRIAPMSQQIWKELFFEPLFPQMIERCFNNIKLQRNHQIIDTLSLKNFLEILNSHGFDEIMSNFSDQNAASINLYQQCFETRFLRDLEEFYRQHATYPSDTDSLLTYCQRVGSCINEEIERTESYLPESTKLLSIQIAEEIFPRDYQKILEDQIKIFFDDNKHEELSIIYKAIRRIPNSKLILMEILKNHIQPIGTDAINSIHTTDLKEPTVYINKILEVYTGWLAMINETFDNDLALVDVLKKACSYFINTNSFIKPTEILVQHCDRLLRNSAKKLEDNEFEARCDQIMLVFDFIEDKDIFEKIYGKMLAKRLINQFSFSDDREKSLVSRLKRICGEGYTSKLERMIKDINGSETITQEYQTHRQNRQEPISVDLSIMILSSNSWSLSLPSTIVLPTELNMAFDMFLQFYSQHHTGRKLTHLYHYSKGELQAYFVTKRYTFEVSLYQMVILLLFNQSSTWTIEQISQETRMKMEIVIQLINGLIKSSLLSCSSLDNEDLVENDVHINYPIKLMVNYRNEKFRINLNLPVKLAKEKQSKNFDQIVDDDRKFIIQAAIVRIMKGEKVLKYSLLVQKVIEEVNVRFKPSIPIIKKCIDVLVEKEYLQRKEDEKDALEYMP